MFFYYQFYSIMMYYRYMNRHAVSKLASVIFLLCFCMYIHAQPRKSSGQKNNKKPSSPTSAPGSAQTGSANEFLNYRGQRKPIESEDFCMQELITGDYEDETLFITLIFNQVLNPKSITAATVCIQNDRPYKVTAISFNKEGSKVQITIKDRIVFPVSFCIANVQSYNGKVIDSVTIEHIEANETLTYSKETGQWKKY